MKIKVRDCSFDEVMQMPAPKHFLPKKPGIFFRTLLKVVSAGELKEVGFTCEKIGMEALGKKEPCLFLMNHSSFIDLKIASTILYPRPFQIVCTEDGLVGKKWLMRRLGCIPKKKFVSDITLLSDMKYSFSKLHSSVLMYPEASYSFDGTATPLPDSIGKCLKHFGVPVVMIRTYGAFSRDPLYNGLQPRKVKVSCEMKYLLSPEQIGSATPEELNEILKKEFSFDNFRWQQENKIRIDESFRADKLDRVLYKCSACGAEGEMVGLGDTVTCRRCKKAYRLDEYGFLRATDSKSKFDHVPDWYTWERNCVKDELARGAYHMEAEVSIYVLRDYHCIYRVGEGTLTHSEEGFHLVGCDGKLDYRQSPSASYGLYADYYWYEIGDMICIGDTKMQYYCFPKNVAGIVAKARIAAEELYKLRRQRISSCTADAKKN